MYVSLRGFWLRAAESACSLCFPCFTSNGIEFINRIQGKRAIGGGLGTHGYGTPFNFSTLPAVRAIHVRDEGGAGSLSSIVMGR